MNQSSSVKNSWGAATWLTIAALSILWWGIAGHWELQRTSLIVWLSLSAFMIGCLIGFLFSSYGEETSTVGKIRDWLIGGITALTVAKAASIKNVIEVFAAGPGPIEFAFAVGAAIFYAGLGFFFMFFQRELILNVLLAQSRAERGKLEGSQQAAQVIQHFLLRLPASLLTGVDYIDEIADVNEAEAKRLKDLLYAKEVEDFLVQADEAARNGTVDWDVASKTAYILYYRTYFEKDKTDLVDKAHDWITRTLNMNPLHVDLTMKYADILSAQKEYEAAATVLERLALRPEAPVLVKQWLGYYLRFVEDRLDDAIRYSKDYHAIFPDETDSLFNIGYAYLQKYCKELRMSGQTELVESPNRVEGLAALKDGLRDQPEMKERVKKWLAEDKNLQCARNDKDLAALLTAPGATDSNATTGTSTQS